MRGAPTELEGSVLRRSVLVACCVFGWVASVAGQGAGTLTGTVTDDTGGVLPGATVGVETDDGSFSAVTDDVGVYRVEGVSAGAATVVVRLVNFSTFREDVQMAAGQTLTVDARLALSITADVVVTGARTFRNIADLENPRENLVGIATSASVGAITSAQLEARPIMRPGEVLEAVPGFVVSQHSGEGKANQYYLRGFNLDHGSDFATTLAGVPLNESSGAHAHGYTDVNALIPELVSGVQYTKGPYFAEHGDFSAAGSANINYVNSLDRPIFSISGGGQGWGRVLGAVSPEVGPGNLLVALELTQNDGPWERPDNMEKANGIIRYSQGDRQNGFSITGMGYRGDWNATDQIPRRAIEQGLIGRFGGIDNTDAGSAYRYSGTFDWLRSGANQSTRFTAYALTGGLNLFQNFTYFLEDPINGDQVEQEGRRLSSGAKMVHRRLGRVFDRPVENAIGVSVRNDVVDTVGLYNTVARRRTNAIRNDEVTQTTAGLFAQSEIEWTRVFRTTLGLRSDVYRYDVTAQNSLNSGDGTAALVSPKITAVLGPWEGTELYLNYGRGFHSNDPRVATVQVDPVSGDPVDREDPLVPANGAEIGLRTVRLPGVQSTVALWYLSFDSELLFVGDAGISEASRPSRRLGVEWTNYVRFASWLTGELDLSFSRARFADEDPAGDFIPGALDRVIAGAITVAPNRRVHGSLRLRHFGPRPLIEDASVKSAATTIWNGEIGFNLNERATITVEGFNLLDSDVSDIDYLYESRLPGEPVGGIEDVHFHPSLPRTARVMLNLLF
ncbi:MAG: TonB-dependent receptor [Acidobacteria bacterium]|nr:TonB-dependent receptor [Acidobacteriota bacterium]